MSRRFAFYLMLSLAFAGSFLFTYSASGQTVILGEESKAGKIEYALFHRDICLHCKDEIEFINKKIMPEYGQYIDLKLYEVGSQENRDIFKQYVYYHKTGTAGSVPVAYIDGKHVAGYDSDKTTGQQILQIIKEGLMARGILAEDNQPVGDGVATTTDSGCINIPVLGTIDPASFSLPILTIVFGLLDGFNPCAMWVLLFLIALLLGIKDKKRMWLLGGIFIISSGIVYFIFMAAWLQFILFIGMVAIIRWLIGLLAMYVGGSSLRKFWKNRKADGVVCEVSGKEKNRRIFDKIKNIVRTENMLLSIIGIILLGFSVNLVELACSAGFPAVFTQVLALADIAAWQRYAYMLGYILFYMLDDMVVFVLAMITLQAAGFGGRYAKHVNAFSGLLIFVLGLLLILKPEWLMFS